MDEIYTLKDWKFIILIKTIWKQNQGVCCTMALPFTLKGIFRQKEELWKLKYFTMQKYKLSKNPLKETKLLQDIRTLL